jgi:hypothetical protein
MQMQRNVIGATVFIAAATALPIGWVVACAAPADQNVGAHEDKVLLARTPDTQYRDIGYLHAAGESTFCTATAISDTVVISAGHCRPYRVGTIPGKDDQVPYDGNRAQQLIFTSDLDGDIRTTGDQVDYVLGRRYEVFVNGTAADVALKYASNLEQYRSPNTWDLTVFGVIVPPGTVGPKTRSNTKGRRLLTGYKDNATPADLNDLVVHAQFDPLTYFESGWARPVMTLGFGDNDVVFLPDGGIDPNGSAYIADDGTLKRNDAGALTRNPAATWFRFLAPAVIKGTYSPSAATPANDDIRRILAGNKILWAPRITQGDSGSPMIASELPNLPAGLDAILGVASTGDDQYTGGARSTYTTFFHPGAAAWLEGRLRNIKADAADDLDFDGVPDRVDNCLSVPNPNQGNTNLETEYELACRAGACPPDDGKPPPQGATPAQVLAWQAVFHGDACDPNSTAKISLDADNADPPLAAQTGCESVVDHFDYQVKSIGACYVLGTNDVLRNDGYRGAPQPFGPDSFGAVEHYACDCPKFEYALIEGELQQQQRCAQARGCAIASQSARVDADDWRQGRFNRITETNIAASFGARSTYSNLLFVQADRSKNPLAGRRAGQRSSVWNLSADLLRMQKPELGEYEGMLWSFAINATYSSVENTPNDYALTHSARTLGGLTTYGSPLPLTASRIPWYEWVMNRAAHRRHWAEVLSPVPQVGGHAGGKIGMAVRAFGISETHTEERTARFSPALLEQLAQVAAGTTVVAWPPASSRPLGDNADVRAVTLAAATGMVTGYMQVASTATDNLAGAFVWTAATDAAPLGRPIAAASYDPATGTLAVIAAGQLAVRKWNEKGFDDWRTGTEAYPGIVALQPAAVGGEAGSYRAIALRADSIRIVDVAANGTFSEVAGWQAAASDSQWAGFGRHGEALLAFRRSGASSARSAVLSYDSGVIRGYAVSGLNHPITTNAAGHLLVMVEGTAKDPSPRLRELTESDVVSEARVLNWLAKP